MRSYSVNHISYIIGNVSSNHPTNRAKMYVMSHGNSGQMVDYIFHNYLFLKSKECWFIIIHETEQLIVIHKRDPFDVSNNKTEQFIIIHITQNYQKIFVRDLLCDKAFLRAKLVATAYMHNRTSENTCTLITLWWNYLCFKLETTAYVQIPNNW